MLQPSLPASSSQSSSRSQEAPYLSLGPGGKGPTCLPLQNLSPSGGVSSETQKSGPQLPAATARGNTLEAALISCTSEKTVKLSLSLPVSEFPSQTNAQSEDLPIYTVEMIVYHLDTFGGFTLPNLQNRDFT